MSHRGRALDGQIRERVVPHSSSPSVQAGEQVTRGKVGNFGTGSAGLIVRKTGAQGRYVLTCGHVLGAAPLDSTATDANQVYSPELSTCCGAECSNPVGNVVRDTLPQLVDKAIQNKVRIGQIDFAVDAALVELSGNTKAWNEVPKIGKIPAVRDLISEWSLSSATPTEGDLPAARRIPVTKYGAKTGLTKGTIAGLRKVPIKEVVNGQVVPGQTAWLFEVEAVAPTGTPPVEEYKLDMGRYRTDDPSVTPSDIAAEFSGSGLTVTVGGSSTQPTLVVRGALFSQPGDSGAPIVDGDHKVVGLLTSGVVKDVFVVGQSAPVQILLGRSHGLFIDPVFRHLKVELLPPSLSSAGRPVAVPGMPLTRARPVDWSAVRTAWAAVEDGELGARLGTLVRHHLHEVRHLVHHNRRVMVTWHRCKGPAFVNAALHAADQPRWPLPAAIDGVSPAQALRAMRDVLLAEGSASLRADIAAHQEQVLDLAERTTSLLDALRLAGRAAPAALRIVNARGVPGVVGALVRDPGGVSYLLSSHHVVFGAGAQEGDAVWALPPTADPGDPGVPTRLGRGRRGHLGLVKFAGETCFVDGALIELDDAADRPAWLREALTGAWPREVAQAEPGAPVHKRGPATGLTQGTLLDVAYPDRPFIEGHTWTAPGQLLVASQDPDRAFSAPGDSGAPLLDEQGHIVGLLWGATAAGDGVACPAEPLLHRLGVVPFGVFERVGAQESQRREESV
ncbi:hypothetical protein ACFYOV_28890 [Streptomyces sp. NPDC005931]|uniref:hypothetical protein n=1 Tax=Streptomyces sp. NPDC005931 TaxID=3364737 RepID=UPI0036A6371A